MATEICIKTRNGTYCSSSPISDCGCARDPAFRDPFDGVPDDPIEPGRDECTPEEFRALSDRDKLKRRLSKVIDQLPPEDTGLLVDKRVDIVRVLKLMALGKVRLEGGFVITGM